VQYSFGTGTHDGIEPLSVVTLDGSDIYGTTLGGGLNGGGRVFQIASGTESSIHDFQQINGFPPLPQAGLVFDSAGSLYGATSSDSENGGGTVYQLAAGSWGYSPIQEFSGSGFYVPGPHGTLLVSCVGGNTVIYGTTFNGGDYGLGSVFELTQSGGSWNLTSLHSFQGGANDGAFPIGSLAVDSSGNLYGTTYNGGSGSCIGGCGIAFRLVP
jgi:uncharacterized repeat protein (TIGR03803 family)